MCAHWHMESECTYFLVKKQIRGREWSVPPFFNGVQSPPSPPPPFLFPEPAFLLVGTEKREALQPEPCVSRCWPRGTQALGTKLLPLSLGNSWVFPCYLYLYSYSLAVPLTTVNFSCAFLTGVKCNVHVSRVWWLVTTTSPSYSKKNTMTSASNRPLLSFPRVSSLCLPVVHEKTHEFGSNSSADIGKVHWRGSGHEIGSNGIASLTRSKSSKAKRRAGYPTRISEGLSLEDRQGIHNSHSPPKILIEIPTWST